MANQRVSQLVQITVPEMVNGDLLLISDINAQESKKLTLGDLGTFLLDGGITGSLYGTASYVTMAATASFVAMQASSSYALSSSWAQNISTASYALASNSASYSVTSSYVITASYALSSSVQIVYSSSFAGNAQSASFLIFNPLSSNGTASYALTASYAPIQTSASYSITASYTPYADTASIAVNSYTASVALAVQTASYLAFNGTPNGTASYALVAGNIISQTFDYGIYNAISQSLSSSQVDSVSIISPIGGLQLTSAEIFGTVTMQYTASNPPVNGRIELFVTDRNSGHSQSLDFTPIYWAEGGAAYTMSGSLKFPFSLCGATQLNGTYEFYVTASGGVFIESTRTTKFRFSSNATQFGVSSAEPIVFNTSPSNIPMYYSSSIHPATLYYGSASQVIFSGSSDATVLSVPVSAISNMSYAWTLSNLKTLITNGNTSLYNIQGVPAGIVTMSVANCNLSILPDIWFTSLGYLDCSNNNISETMVLPPSMSYLKCSGNVGLILPSSMPQGLQVLLADSLFITDTPSYFPPTLLTMSLGNCINLNSWDSPILPSSLLYLDCHSSQLTTIPPIPTPCIYLNVSNCQFQPSTMGTICAEVDTNGLSNGTLNIFNNPNSASAPSILTHLANLRSRGWTVIS